MYLSRVLLNNRRRETLRALASPQVIHGAIESSIRHAIDTGGSRKRLLWRIDYMGNQWHLLLLSEEQPNLSLLVQQFGFPDSHPQGETRAYTPLLEKLERNQIWQFRLLANPVRSSFKETDSGSGRGKIFAHVTTEQQKQWLLARAETGGFSIHTDTFDVVHSGWKRFRKSSQGRHQVVLRTATFEGILSICDVERFRQTLINGMGRAKAYGCGMLTIMRSAEGRL